jgi:ubiquinone biosynthesis protein COQ4
MYHSAVAKRPLRIGDAVTAMRALLRDPDDTAQVFRIIDALSGNTVGRTLRRMRRGAGARLVAERPSLIDMLRDRDVLGRLPAGSVGRGYLEFVTRERITAEGLVDASELGGARKGWGEPLAPDEQFVADRMRDSHDLWHVVTGYHGDLVGEAALLAFTLAQTYNTGIAFIVLAALPKLPADARRLVLGAFLRGMRAAWLPEQPWEDLLALPLDEVRERLRLGPAPSYQTWRTSQVAA